MFERTPGNSVAAIIVTDERRYLLQHRDDLPNISFSGMWGLFGGECDSGEEPAQALRRELAEELGVDSSQAVERIYLTFDGAPMGGALARRRYYQIAIRAVDVDDYVLAEGQAMRLFTIDEIATRARTIIPYDLCALMMYERYRASTAP